MTNRFTQALVLLLVLFQLSYVSAEPWFLAYSTDAEHHILLDNNQETPAFEQSQADYCDHCCFCHGHSSHLGINKHISDNFHIPMRMTHFSLVKPNYYRQLLPSIYRPPISAV